MKWSGSSVILNVPHVYWQQGTFEDAIALNEKKAVTGGVGVAAWPGMKRASLAFTIVAFSSNS
jgi:hypothetical protein